MCNRSFALALLSFSLWGTAIGCKRGSPVQASLEDAGRVRALYAIDDVGSAPPTLVVLPDAGPDAVAAAEQAVHELNPRAPPVRLDLIADLLASELLGIAPGAPAEALEKKLGSAAVKRGDTWRWPALGVEAVVAGGTVQRLALHASARESDPEMKIFVGEVLVGSEPLTEKAPQLELKQVALALGIAGARGQQGPEVTELCWRRGSSALYLTFDDRTLALEAIVFEPFSQQLWDAMKPLEKTPALWDREAPDAAADRPSGIAFAQVAPELTAGVAAKMRLIADKQPRGKLLFDHLQAQFLGPGVPLRQIGGRRAAMLRSDGCTYLALERTDGTWEARSASNDCTREKEPEGVWRLAKTFASPGKK